MGLKCLLGSDQVISSGFQSSKGGTFGCCWGMGLELLGEKADKWSVEGASLCSFVRISWSKCVVNTDSAILRVGINPQYFPWLRVPW